jgi:hypothetical protein
MFRHWRDLTLLTVESQHVIWLRILKLAAGGASASAEAHRMVTEKVTAAAQIGTGLALGGSPAKVIGRYRRKVRANRRRLTK